MIEIGITSNAQQVVAQLREFPPAMLTAIARALDLENELTVGHIQKDHLTGHGPFPPSEHRLGVISNRLRSSLWPSAAKATPEGVISSIGTNVSYAGSHEYGFDGTVTVRSFTRRIFARRGQAFRESTFTLLKYGADGRIKKGRTIRKKIAAEVTVRSFTRRMRMPERAPIRTGIEERMPNYKESISRAILSAWQGPTP